MKVRPIVLVNFQRYNPPPKTLSKEQRAGGPLKWVRLQCDWYDDADLLDSEDAMILWPRLLAVAGRSHGVVRMTVAQLARRVRLPDDVTERGLDHLHRRGIVRFTIPKGGAHHPEGGSEVANG